MAGLTATQYYLDMADSTTDSLADRIIGLVLLLFIVVVLWLAATADVGQQPNQTVIRKVVGQPVHLLVEADGAKLFKHNCAVCHLNNIANAPHPTSMRLDLNVVKRGRGFMPGFSHLTDEEIKTIFKYIKTIK